MKMQFIFGRSRYFRPVCIRRRNGFSGGPSFYKETDSPAATPLILAEVRAGRLPLYEAENILDRLENEL